MNFDIILPVVILMYSNELICDILEFIDTNLNRKITIEEVSKKFFYNRYYIMKLFKKELGITFINYINCMRVYNSIKSIQYSNDSFTKIALCNGFYSLEYFSEIFNKVMGVSPTLFKNYYKYKYRLSDLELITISSNWIELQTLVETVNEYKKNKIPKISPVLKRSIFN